MQTSDFWTQIACLYGSQKTLVTFCMENSLPSIRITSLYGSISHLWFCAIKTATLGLEYKSLWVQDPTCAFWMQNSDFMTGLTILYGPQTSSVVLSTHNSVLSTRIKLLYGFQPSPVVLCIQNSNFSTWITSLFWSKPSSENFACKPATFGPKLHISMGPRNHLWLFAWKTACLSSELLVSIGPALTCGFVHSKQRL